MDKICGHTIIALLLAIIISVPLYFDTRIYSCYDLSKTTLLYMLVFALIITWSIKRLINNSESILIYNKLSVPIACFVIIAIISTVFSVDPLISVLGTYKRYNGLLSLFIYLVLFFAITNFVRRDMIELFINMIIISTIPTCIYGICQRHGFDYFQWNTNYGHGIRIFSTMGHPAFLSAYLVMVIPLVYYKIMQTDRMRDFILMLFCAAIILAAFYMTKTRATFIALFFSHVFFFVLMGRELLRKNKVKLIIVGAVFVIISVVYNVWDEQSAYKRIVESVKVNESGNVTLAGTAGTRYNNLLVAIEIFKDYPVLGIGFDNLGRVFPEYITRVYKQTGQDVGSLSEIQDRIHNDIGDMLVNVGVLGLLAYLYCIYIYVRMMWCSRHEHRLLVLALGTGVFAYWVQNMFSFGHVPIITLFWIMIGLSVIVCERNLLTRSSV